MNYKKLVISILAPLLAGFLGSFFTSPAIDGWYSMLEKPVFNPPNWIFGPVWTTLYILMGISVYLIWRTVEKKKPLFGRKQQKQVKLAVSLFWIHLIFNATWSIIFFGLESPAFAFVNIVIIWAFILVLMIKFWPINRWSTILLAPYFLWVSFASVLNASIWYLNV